MFGGGMKILDVGTRVVTQGIPPPILTEGVED